MSMLQILQSYKSGELWLAEVPVPACKSGGIVMQNRVSFVSAGTEKMLVDFAKKTKKHNRQSYGHARSGNQLAFGWNK